MTPALEFRNVTIRYESHSDAVIHGLSLTLEAGERVALLGLNGSGKTTLLLAAVGLLPFEGTILVEGIAVAPNSLRMIRSKVGFLFSVPEDQLLFPGVLEDVTFGAMRAGIPKTEAHHRALQIMSNLGVTHLADTPLHRLSHGQKQRIALAGALVTTPPVLLLDEPSAGLDPPARRQLAIHLCSIPAAQLIATHDLDFAGKACNRYVLLENGCIQLEGDASQGMPDAF